MSEVICIAIGGALGANARYWIGRLIFERIGSEFPYGTFFVNISGSFFLGFFLTAITERYIGFDPLLRLLVSAGFLGSYTTFSTLGYETFGLAVMGNYSHAIFNAVATLLVGLTAVWLGAAIATHL